MPNLSTNKELVAVRVHVLPDEEVEINAWTLGLEEYYPGAQSQAEWAYQHCQDCFTYADWYQLHEDLDPNKYYELYIVGTMRGSVDHNGEADEEFDIDNVAYRELSAEELDTDDDMMSLIGA